LNRDERGRERIYNRQSVEERSGRMLRAQFWVGTREATGKLIWICERGGGWWQGVPSYEA
jgi:hypothetical protein